MVSKNEIVEVLKECYDPEIPINIVDLGLIYDVAVKSRNVAIKMTLTALGCPLSKTIIEEIKQRVLTIKRIKNVEVNIVFDPPWSPEKMSQEARRILGI